MVSAGHVSGTRGCGSGIVSGAAVVLWTCVVRGMRGVGGICKIVCVWLGVAWVERGGEWKRGLGWGLTNPVGTGGVLGVCLCLGCGGVGGE